jgi:hypothetical protein
MICSSIILINVMTREFLLPQEARFDRLSTQSKAPYPYRHHRNGRLPRLKTETAHVLREKMPRRDEVPSQKWLEFESGVISDLWKQADSALARRRRSRHGNG